MIIPDYYAEMVTRLAKSPTELRAQWNDNYIHAIHGIIGMAGEAAEELMGAVAKCIQTDDYADGLADTWWLQPDGEVAIDVSNIIEELGDLSFYECQLREFLGFQEVIVRPVSGGLWYHDNDPIVMANKGGRRKVLCDLVVALTVIVGRVVDTTKRIVIYGNDKKDHEATMNQNLSDLDWTIMNIAHLIGVTRDGLRRSNQEKLDTGDNARYGEDGYSDEAATARRDKAAEATGEEYDVGDTRTVVQLNYHREFDLTESLEQVAASEGKELEDYSMEEIEDMARGTMGGFDFNEDCHKHTEVDIKAVPVAHA